MASIQKSGSKWRVQVYVKGQRDSSSFRTKQEASAWALNREAELGGKKLPDKTFGDAMKEYERNVATHRGGARWELTRLKVFMASALARRKLASLGADDFINWRDERNRKVKPATTAREMNLLQAVLKYARRELRWMRDNPMAEVTPPKKPKGRARRITATEERELTLALGQRGKLQAQTPTHRIGLAFLFALETAMRSGEICALTWDCVYLSSRYVTLPKTKNGESRDVPLSPRAKEILEALPRGDGPVFGLTDQVRDVLFRKARDNTPHREVHFHDTRAEAIFRLSKKFDVLELARVIGHRDINSLLIYYRSTASELAKKLG
ncbi:tyrosine-type recombinase/integrase [Dyella japonica]|uniref:Integrase n=1 Tax=Dyella japonica TaxID=231455 RepID=A0ABV2JYX9_9GAMM